MSRIVTIPIFIQRAQKIHGNYYDYSKTIYESYFKKIEIVCPSHGSFFQTPSNHLQGRKCRKCARTLTTEEFIKKAFEIHSDYFNYSKTKYVTSHIKIEIICPIHGSFFQTPNGHLNGAGCPKCAVEKTHNQQRLTTEEFINRSKEIHKNKYEYRDSVYKGWESKISIKCPNHGIFDQRACDHFKSGCPKCAREHTSEIERRPLNNFIFHSNKTHGNKYDYSKTIYKNNRTKVAIICPRHGMFFTSPENHLIGYGCIKCNKEKRNIEYQKYFIKKSKEIHGDFYNYSRSIFIGHMKKIKIICPKHGTFFQLADSHLRGSGCIKCILKQESKLEKIIKEFFKGWIIKRHKKLYSKEHGKYRYFDFFLKSNNYKIIIEYDGKQHFEPVRFSKKMTREKAEEKFKSQKRTDELDPLFCKRKGIKLYRVSYKENMAEFLKNLPEIREANLSP